MPEYGPLGQVVNGVNCVMGSNRISVPAFMAMFLRLSGQVGHNKRSPFCLSHNASRVLFSYSMLSPTGVRTCTYTDVPCMVVSQLDAPFSDARAI